mmetsp:Transcript_3302/g.8204  ORF Transcript_3302/g.8204 Transcript_3302/m.8204 type:complete len:128 (+) Transcript_3302:47-430(+)
MTPPSTMHGPQFVTMPWASTGRGGDGTSHSFTMDDVHRFLSSYSSSTEQSDGLYSSAEAELLHSSWGVPECLSDESFAEDVLDASSRTEDLDDSSEDDEGGSPKLHWAPLTARRSLQGPRFTRVVGG